MSLFENEEALSRLSDLIKVGEVSSINPAAGTARVVFDDDDGAVSYDLPILQRNNLQTQDFHSVNVGEDVLCLFLPSGPEEGFILGSFYAGEIETPESTEKRRTTVFEDGTIVRYDMASHTLTVLIEGTKIVADRQNVTVTAPNAVNVNCTTAAVKASESVTLDTPTTDVTGVLNVTGLITGKGGFAISGGSGATCKVSGTIELDGSMTSSGDVQAGGISLQSHTHTAQGPDAETSGPNG